MYSMGSGEGMKKHVPKVRFEPCAEAKAVGLEIAKEESLSRAAFLNIRLSTPGRSKIEVGLAVLADTSGKLLNQRRACSRKDVIGNPRESCMVLVLVTSLELMCKSCFCEA